MSVGEIPLGVCAAALNGRERVPADAVADAAAAAGVKQPAFLRRTTVDLRIEAQSADDSYLAPLVAEALQEFLEQACDLPVRGKFESKAGLDVTWNCTNEYFENGQREYASDGSPLPRPVPLAVAQLAGDCLVIDGVRYSLAVFKTLANPDSAKRYAFTRQGDTVAVVERP